MNRKTSRHLMGNLLKGPLFVTVTVISISISLGFILLEEGSIVQSFTFAVTGSLLSLALEIGCQQQQIGKEQTENINKLTAFLGLHQQALKNKKISELLTHSVECFKLIESDVDDHIELRNSYFDRISDKFITELSHLKSGTIYHMLPVSEAWSRSEDIVKRVRKNGKCVTYGKQYEQWLYAYGSGYQDANIEALSKGVEIERIFIIPNDSSHISNLQEVLKKQIDMGVQVYIALEEDLSAQLREDYAIWDDKYLIKSEIGADGNINSGLHSMDHRKVASFHEKFKRTLARSKPFRRGSTLSIKF